MSISRRHLYLSIPIGMNVRDTLRLGTLREILALDPPVQVTLLTPARLVPEFQAEFASDRVRIVNLSRFRPTEWLGRLASWRRRAKARLVRNAVLKMDMQLCHPPEDLRELFRADPPTLVMTVHPQDWWDWQLVTYARSLGIPTAGVVRSWDNIQRGLNVLPDRLAVWNEHNEQEAIRMEGYRADEITVVGPPPFDLYFDPSIIRPREEFLTSLGLDPSKKLVMYAPAGQVMEFGDEVFHLEELLLLRDTVPELEGFQILCRLHPNSNLQFFAPYGQRGVTFSFGSYVKTLGWSMTRDEVAEMANMIHHADVILAGGTTVVIEAAIFKTPAIVAGYHSMQPEHVKKFLEGWTFATHYRPIMDRKWLPVARSRADLETMLATAFTDPAWFADERRAMTEYYVPFRDGMAARRIAQWVGRLLEGS